MLDPLFGGVEGIINTLPNYCNVLQMFKDFLLFLLPVGHRLTSAKLQVSIMPRVLVGPGY